MTSKETDALDEEVVEATLTADGGQTILVLRQRGLPLNQLAAYGAGLQIHDKDLAAHIAGHERAAATRWNELLPAYQGLAANIGWTGSPCHAPQESLMSDSIKFGGVTLDCPNAGELAAFYAEITGGEVTVPGDSWALMTCPDGSAICFQGAAGYSPPTWPGAPSSQQIHLDFDVDDLDATELRVLAAGASKYEFQPNDHCRVYADPAGHPFCLSTFAVLQEPG